MFTFHQERVDSKISILFVFFLVLFLVGCASTETVNPDVDASEVKSLQVDPYEGLNRKVYVFNEGVDNYFAEPVSEAYLWVTPKFVQTGVANFFSNLTDINVVLK